MVDEAPTEAPRSKIIRRTERRPIHRRLYDWVLAWANHPAGTWALFFIAVAESSFFPIPPDPLLWALCISRPERSFWYALVCSVGSVAGGMLGYLIGLVLWDQVSGFFYEWVPGFTPQAEAAFRSQYEQHDVWIVFLAGFTPIPYKVITILSGVMQMSFGLFVIASVVGRSARFAIGAGLIKVFGPPIRRFIDRYFNLLSIGFAALLVAGFVVIKYLV